MSMEEYAKRRAEFVELEKSVKKVGEYIARAGARIRDNTDQAFFSNSGDVGYPMEVIASGREGINANEWPTADKLARQLADYHKSKQAMMDAWGRLSTEQKQSMQGPPVPDARFGRR